MPPAAARELPADARPLSIYLRLSISKMDNWVTIALVVLAVAIFAIAELIDWLW